MRSFVAALWLAMFCSNAVAAAQDGEHTPTLLLSAQRLRRLQRDRVRQTVRWVNFERRVREVPDSAERGFELGLYYAVTRDEARGREAVAWSIAHPCERRQVALVTDWTGELATENLKAKLEACPQAETVSSSTEMSLRDQLFIQIANGHIDAAQTDRNNKRVVDDLETAPIDNPFGLYAAVEYLMTIRGVAKLDLREQNASFFLQLPKQILLSLTPEQIEHPEWMIHIAALALVGLDPNLGSSQFLQGWAMEDRQMLRDGPGVAYEFLWADPYLPGIAYQNMDPWIYNVNGTLFARSNWESDACWMNVTARGVKEESCSRMNEATNSFGTLTLSKMLTGCANIAPRKSNETTILWGMKPNAQIAFDNAHGRTSAAADPAGMWSVPNEVAGKVCVNRHDRP